jgi:hypothetical protein
LGGVTKPGAEGRVITGSIEETVVFLAVMAAIAIMILVRQAKATDYLISSDKTQAISHFTSLRQRFC